ncbi:putative spermidine/putrescine transport system substrate-binding protein [Pontibacter mucosus]|uniref:Putative spermidine/putrescine transport system substrate-binding protein n=1 Tax=Pontibacter mucosus TaxID=1649266 RepID=A0A2T5YGK5_9BACT|nr:ABC transporter substrate-binding protein [Pontibacter mucosus]PTX18424.1 putative spermidine/putrescine transport system substrate-binding protein [Pontibacter mucosus]
MKDLRIFLLLITFLTFGCGSDKPQEQLNVQEADWASIEAAAKGTSVQLMMWQGDPLINKYMQDYVKPQLQKQYGITLDINSGQGKDIVGLALGEKETGKTVSEMDVAWINGETFYQLRQLDALYGPFTELLPNNQYVNWQNPFIARDFQQPVEGMEAPWGNVQLAFIYNAAKVQTPPTSFSELESYIKNNPGTFTIPNEFTGMTLLKSWLIALAGEEELAGKFDEAKYKKYSQQLWQKINYLKPYFWKQGQTFPATLSQLHQLYANGEVNFTFSNNDGEVDNKILQGVFPESSRAYVPEPGTIQNTHYLGILKRSGNLPGALVVINFLQSPEAQYRKASPEVWGDGTVLATEKLPAEWQEKFRNIPARRHAPDRTAIQDRAFEELAPEYMIRLYDDFRTAVIEQN